MKLKIMTSLAALAVLGLGACSQGDDVASTPAVKSGIEQLINAIRAHVFPQAHTEARELFKVHGKPGGPMARQASESMQLITSQQIRRNRSSNQIFQNSSNQNSSNQIFILLAQRRGLRRERRAHVLLFTTN